MIYQLRTAKRYEYRKSEIKKLEPLGFEFKGCDIVDKDVYISINTLEKLIKLSEQVGTLIYDNGEIMIYNDYIE